MIKRVAIFCISFLESLSVLFAALCRVSRKLDPVHHSLCIKIPCHYVLSYPSVAMRKSHIVKIAVDESQESVELGPWGAATTSNASYSGSMPRPALFSAMRYL